VPDEQTPKDGSDAFWHSDGASLLARLQSGEQGLTEAEAAQRLERYGPNQIVGKGRRHLLADLQRRLANPLTLILLAASAVAGSTGDVASFVIIAGIVVLSTLLDMVQERRAEATAEALRRSIALSADVWRDGARRSLPVADLVPGDVVDLRRAIWCPPMAWCWPPMPRR
jgi:Mg2+-importing ATPase